MIVVRRGEESRRVSLKDKNWYSTLTEQDVQLWILMVRGYLDDSSIDWFRVFLRLNDFRDSFDWHWGETGLSFFWWLQHSTKKTSTQRKFRMKLSAHFSRNQLFRNEASFFFIDLFFLTTLWTRSRNKGNGNLQFENSSEVWKMSDHICRMGVSDGSIWFHLIGPEL